MRPKARFFLIALPLALLLLLAAAPSSGAGPAGAPALLVVLVVDQMRADYIDRFGHQWTGGLRRLIDRGALFRRAAYPYLGTVTCAGHATIATGAFPASHGMVQNTWWDRAEGRRVSCTDDETASTIGHGRSVPPRESGHSPARLLLPTLPDELRLQAGTPPRIVSLSLKARSAVMLAGQRADLVAWFEGAGGWVTSSAYAPRPIPFLERFVAASPVERDFEKTWTRTLPPASYLYEDDAEGEQPPAPWTAAFPHALRGAAGEAEAASYGLWRMSPFSDEYLARLAVEAVDSLRMGRGPGTDYLAVAFSALDSAGHNFGPRSHEVQDVLVRLDATLGALLEALDERLGRDRYVVALSADHGVSPVPEQVADAGISAGRIDLRAMEERLEQALSPVLGAGSLIAAMIHTDIFFAPGVYDRLRADPAAGDAARRAVESTPGVLRVFDSEELRHGQAAADPVLRAAALSHTPERSGDLVFVPRPYWITSAAAATHGTQHLYDAGVPVVLYGAGVRPGRYFEPATPADIAPTLGFLAGVTLPWPDGRVLVEALAAAAPAVSSRTPRPESSDPDTPDPASRVANPESRPR